MFDVVYLYLSMLTCQPLLYIHIHLFQFHFLLNVAVGGTGGFFPDNTLNHDGLYPKPWENSMLGKEAKDSFYEARPDWQWTWDDNSALQVDYVRVYKIK